jgi:TRAP-type C4-dicarboxylate transport system substrate-binding protein
MNLDTWNSLPDDLKAAFDQVADAAAARAGAIWDYAHEHAMEVSGDIGHQFAYMPDDELAKLTEAIKPVKDNYMQYLDDQGLPGQQIIDDCVSLMTKANAAEYEKWTPPTE